MRSSNFKRLSIVLMLLLAVFLLCASSVFATAAKPPVPMIDKAVIHVEPKGEGTSQVTETITLQNANAAKDKKIEHVMVTFPGSTMKDVLISKDQTPLTFTEVQGDGVKRIFVNVPDGTTALTYTIQYTAEIGKGENRIPLMVPFYSTNGIKNTAVELNFNLPKGMYLHSSMPNYLGADNAPAKETLTGVPSFVIFDYGPTPKAVSTNTWIGILNVIVILIVLAWWLIYEGRKGGVVNV
jgi:hypothetical protein